MPAFWPKNMDEGRGKDTRMDALCPELKRGFRIKIGHLDLVSGILRTTSYPENNINSSVDVL